MRSRGARVSVAVMAARYPRDGPIVRSTSMPSDWSKTTAVSPREMVLRPFPRETLPGANFEYAAVTLEDGSRLRTIVSVPTTAGRHAAVMLIQGGGCGSVDVPMAPDTGPAGLLRPLASHGYVTMRVEKSGVGDSRGPAC